MDPSPESEIEYPNCSRAWSPTRVSPTGEKMVVEKTVLGAAEGNEDGACDCEGATEGVNDGRSVGDDVGTPEGVALGSKEGTSDGLDVGSDEGLPVGMAEGCREGIAVGVEDGGGGLVGAYVGDGVEGIPVGW